MADAAVALGIPRALACRAAAQAVLGSAKMVLDTDRHTAQLKDMVCSPAARPSTLWRRWNAMASAAP